MKNESTYRPTVRETRLQPLAENEVTSPEQIFIGMEIADVHGDQVIGTTTVVSEPYATNIGPCVDVADSYPDVLEADKASVYRIFLADKSVVPYENGKWNPCNRMLDITGMVGGEGFIVDRTKLVDRRLK